MARKRKTREEKIIAQLRRELKESKKELKGFKKEKAPEKKTVKKRPVPETSITLAFNPHLKRDLTKTLILSILAIATELVVYWFTARGYDILDLPARLKTELF